MGRKDEAQRLFDHIGSGSFYAVKRPKNSYTDRIFRRLVEAANKSGDCIICGKTGYYRPCKENPIDRYEKNIYLAQERKRAREINQKCDCMEKAYATLETVVQSYNAPDVFDVDSYGDIPGQMVMRLGGGADGV